MSADPNFLTKSDMVAKIHRWLAYWDGYHLDGVMELMHEDVVFDNWTGETISGKAALTRAWKAWFLLQGNFKFVLKDLFVDEQAQKALFQWQLQWPSLERAHKGQLEIREGVDVLHFFEGKILKKYSFSKTTLMIAGAPVVLSASP